MKKRPEVNDYTGECAACGFEYRNELPPTYHATEATGSPCLCVWRDKVSEPGVESIIVSSDNGGSNTIRVFSSDEMDAAKEFARETAAKRGLEAVIESPAFSGQWRPL